MGTGATGPGGMGPGGMGSGGDGGEEPIGYLDCDGELCPVGPQSACCWDRFLAYGAPQAECVMGTVATDGCQTDEDGGGYETRIECQTDEHCGGTDVCCGVSPGGQQYYINTRCMSEGQCLSMDVGRVLCETEFDCPMGMLCYDSGWLPDGYNFCADPN